MSGKGDDKANANENYTFGKFVKKHKILTMLLGGIPVVACVIFIPILCHREFNIFDLGSFIGGTLAYLGTVLLGAVSMWQNERQKIENDKILIEERKQAEEDKNYLIEQNKRIAYDSARLSLLPVFAVNKIPYSIRSRLFGTFDNQKAEEKTYGYFEGDSWYFAITLNDSEIAINTNETKEIQRYKSNAFASRKDKNGVLYICDKDDAYIPYIIRNIGRANANKFSFAIYKDGCIDEKFSKHIIARPFDLTDELRLDFYIPNTKIEATYWLEFTYADLLGNQYRQKDYIKIQKNNSQVSIDFPQILEEQNNG